MFHGNGEIRLTLTNVATISQSAVFRKYADSLGGHVEEKSSKSLITDVRNDMLSVASFGSAFSSKFIFVLNFCTTGNGLGLSAVL